MISELKRFEIEILQPLNLSISDIIPDLECEDYFGFNFKISKYNIKFRKAKITPKKIGKFVTLWKRNQNKETEPFDISDQFDFYIVAVTENEKSGFFFFPKYSLENHQILSNENKLGKRGFRVYTNWDFPNSQQAIKTKTWQSKFFISFENDPEKNAKKFISILSY